MAKISVTVSTILNVRSVMHEPPVLQKYLKLFVEKPAFRDLLSLPLLAWSERLSDNMMGRLDRFKKHWHHFAQNVVHCWGQLGRPASNGGHSMPETEGLSNLTLSLFHCTMPVSSFSLVLIHFEELYFDCNGASLKIDWNKALIEFFFCL